MFHFFLLFFTKFLWIPQLYLKLSFSIEIPTEDFQPNTLQVELWKILISKYENWVMSLSDEIWVLKYENWVNSKPNMPLFLLSSLKSQSLIISNDRHQQVSLEYYSNKCNSYLLQQIFWSNNVLQPNLSLQYLIEVTNFSRIVILLLGVAKLDTTHESDTTKHEISRLWVET